MNRKIKKTETFSLSLSLKVNRTVAIDEFRSFPANSKPLHLTSPNLLRLFLRPFSLEILRESLNHSLSFVTFCLLSFLSDALNFLGKIPLTWNSQMRVFARVKQRDLGILLLLCFRLRSKPSLSFSLSLSLSVLFSFFSFPLKALNQTWNLITGIFSLC